MSENNDPKQLLYHICCRTTSGLQHSKFDAWKYHQYWPGDPESFARQYADYLFSFRRGVTAIDVTVIDLQMPVTRTLIEYVGKVDQSASESPLNSNIIARFSFSRENMPLVKRGDN